jgi:hypothetical protein
MPPAVAEELFDLLDRRKYSSGLLLMRILEKPASNS